MMMCIFQNTSLGFNQWPIRAVMVSLHLYNICSRPDTMNQFQICMHIQYSIYLISGSVPKNSNTKLENMSIFTTCTM